MTDRIRILESKHQLSILLHLLENGPCMKTEIYRGVSSNPSMPSKLNDLAGLGLIVIEIDDKGTSSIRLTDKGRVVAGMVKGISMILDEE